MIKDLLEQYCTKLSHAKQTAAYSLMIFDSMKEKKNFTEKERKYLESAALLHDIGYFIDRKSHHKHSMNMILEAGAQGKIEEFSQDEIEIIAHIARYHRSSAPDEAKHEKFALLSSEQKEIIKKLSPILRLADGLDNPAKNLITSIKFEETPESMNFYLRTVGFLPKLTKADEKKDLFEELYNKPLNLISKRI